MSELFFAFLSTRAEHRDPDTCRRVLVGPMREFLEKRGDPATFARFPEMPSHVRAVVADSVADREKLIEFCARCRRCDWGEKY